MWRRHGWAWVRRGAVAVAALAGFALLVAWSGLYNVGASRGHWLVVEWMLGFVMRNSVERHASGIVPPPLDDPDLYRLGAAHFHGGCADCHGAPGVPISQVALHMLPVPPDLSQAAPQWRDAELFWIIKHGVKYTGMPAWVARDRDDEVWAVAAFLRRLPSLDASQYRELAFGGLPAPARSGRELALTDANAALGACARCHGYDRRGPSSRRVPVLHGQPADYLAAALRAYASGARQSGIMQPIAATLSSEAVQAVAGYYAGLAPPAGQDMAAPEAVERGRLLSTHGEPAGGVPPCLPCHGAGALPSYPRLAGQPAPYLATQLRLQRRGGGAVSATGAIMAPIAARLTDRQIDDAAAFFASQVAVRADGRP